jgi:SAM-dependent methyltransferase
VSISQDRLAQLMHRVIADLGAVLAAGGVVLGGRLGLYRALAEGPVRPLELARQTGTAPRYLEEWLRGQAAGGYIRYDPGTGEYSLTPEQAYVLADEPGYVPDAFGLAIDALRDEPCLSAAFRSGGGFAWHEHDSRLSDGHARLRAPWYAARLVPTWLAALEGVVAKLDHGARVADIACGQAGPTILMAQAFPRSTFVGLDSHPDSVATARARVTDLGLSDRVRIDVAWARELGGGPYDLITTFDALHDMGDPPGAARHVAEQLAPDGTWMIVEPFAGGTPAENLTPTGRYFYAISVLLCVPRALSQEGGYSLGAQAGEEPIRRLVTAAGFSRFRAVARDPFTAVYEARP